MKKFLLLMIGIFLLSFSPVLSVEIWDCGGLVASGVYTLTRDIVDSSSNICMKISANDVTLDCQGHTIGGKGNGYGIYTSKNNIVIKNCTITNWDYGISYYYTGAYGKIENNIIKSNNRGIYIAEVNSNNITNNVIESNDYGIMLFSTNNYIIKNNEIKSNSKGIYFDSKSNRGNIYNNLFSNDNNVVLHIIESIILDTSMFSAIM